MNDPDALHPTAGVRILLELDASDAAGARYRAAIFAPVERFEFSVTIALPDGKVTIDRIASDGAATAEPPGIDLLRAMARGLARDEIAARSVAATSNGAGSAPTWPRRLLRWRDR